MLISNRDVQKIILKLVMLILDISNFLEKINVVFSSPLIPAWICSCMHLFVVSQNASGFQRAQCGNCILISSFKFIYLFVPYMYLSYPGINFKSVIDSVFNFRVFNTICLLFLCSWKSKTSTQNIASQLPVGKNMAMLWMVQSSKRW